MRRALLLATVLAAVPAAQTPAPGPAFRLYFFGHEIGHESIVRPAAGGDSGNRLAESFETAFHFEDRGTAIDLTAVLNRDSRGRPSRLVVKGRNYRLFSSDSEVTTTGDRLQRISNIRDVRWVVTGGRMYTASSLWSAAGFGK